MAVVRRRGRALVSGFLAAGAHVADWDTRSVPAGIYFLRLTAGDCPRTGTVPKTLTAKVIVGR